MEDSVSVSLSNRCTTNTKKKKRFTGCSWPPRGSQKVTCLLFIVPTVHTALPGALPAWPRALPALSPELEAGTLEPHTSLQCLKPVQGHGEAVALNAVCTGR